MSKRDGGFLRKNLGFLLGACARYDRKAFGLFAMYTVGCALLGLALVFLMGWQGNWGTVSAARLLLYMLLPEPGKARPFSARGLWSLRLYEYPPGFHKNQI